MRSTTITLHKTKFEFHFGIGFLGEMLKEHDLGIEQLLKEMQSNIFDVLPKLMLESAKYAAKRKGKELNYTLYDFVDAIDDDGGVASVNVMKFSNGFMQSIIQDVPKEEDEVKTTDKKGPKKK